MMESLRNSLLPETAQSFQEGLPYWAFWLLLGVIVLLLFFIFLRDKDLRRRIDFFFLSARNRSLQLHLQRQIRREKKRKEALWLQIGQIIYESRLSLTGTEALFLALDSLVAKRNQLETELLALQENMSRFEATKKFSPAGAADQKISSGSEPATASIKERPQPASEPVEPGVQLASWKRRYAKLREKIKDIIDHERAYLTTLGRIADTRRPDDGRLQRLYHEIDQINLRLSHIEQRLDSLHPF